MASGAGPAVISWSVTVDVVGAADLGQHQAQAHPALGDLAVFGLQLVLGLGLVLVGQAAPRSFGLRPAARWSANSASTMLGGSGKSCLSSSTSSSARFSLKRAGAGVLAASDLGLQRRPSAPRGSPARGAWRARRRPGARPAPCTSLTLTSNSAALPFRFSAWIVLGEGHLHRHVAGRPWRPSAALRSRG